MTNERIKAMASDKLAKVEQLLKALGRDAQQVEDFELGDQMARTINYALQLLEDVQLEADADGQTELAVLIDAPLAA
jgi:hypothetical protein